MSRGTSRMRRQCHARLLARAVSALAIALSLTSAGCGSSRSSTGMPPIGQSLGPSRGEIAAPCRALCAMGPSAAGSTRAAPAFSLKNEKGETVTFESLRGKVVIVNLWIAIPEVLPDMPELAKLWALVRARKDVAFVSIAGDGLPERPKEMLRTQFGAAEHYPVLFDPTGTVAQDFGTFQFPETWIVDPGGILRARFDGARKWSDANVLAFIDSLRDGRFCPIEIEDGRMSGLGSDYCDAPTVTP